MKNVIILIVDSLCYDIVRDKRYGESATKFLDSIEEECITATHLYSQGPFTESGLIPLLCSCNTMDKGGYLGRFSDVDNFFTFPFKEAGYEVYHSYYQLFMYSQKIRDSIDHKIYIDIFDYRMQWEARTSFYIEKYNSGKFSKYDMKNCITEYDTIFSLMLEQYCDENDENWDGEKYDLIRDILPENIDYIRSIIRDESQLFYVDRESYIECVLKEGKEHRLYKELQINNKVKINDDNLHRIVREKKRFFDKSKAKAFFDNKNLKISVGNLMHSVLSDDRLYLSNAIARYGKYKDYVDFIEKQKRMYVPSMGKQILYMIDRIQNRDNSSNSPFLFEMHFEEPHYFNTFISYDIDEYSTIRDEIDYLEKDLNSINNRFDGILQYRQSVVYADYWIKYLFSFLEKTKLIDDTVVLITADHGSSYCYEPIRNELRVANCHTANYHIPMYIYDKSINGETIEGYYTSKDVIPTLLDVVGIHSQEFPTKNSMRGKHTQPTICHSEYLGTGFPDYVVRPIQYSVRNQKYLLSYFVKASDDFDKGIITAIYDLVSDPGELKNLKDSLDVEDVKDLLEYIESRHNDIQNQYKEIISEA